jgi:hypothetical protein
MRPTRPTLRKIPAGIDQNGRCEWPDRPGFRCNGKRFGVTVLREKLYVYTVFACELGAAMQTSLRQTYQPRPDNTPKWLRRLWLWF